MVERDALETMEEDARGSGCARARAVERDAVEIMEEDARGSGCARVGSVELVDNARPGCQVRQMIAEISYCSCLHGCAIDDGKKGHPR